MNEIEFFGVQPEQMIRDCKSILVWPNITKQDDLEADSFIVVIRNLVAELSKVRNDLYWHIVLPQRLTCLEFPNVNQIILPIPSYPNTMRLHFDAFKVKEKLEGLEFDLVYCHLPEQATQVKNLLRNSLGCLAPIVGYVHWFEFPGIAVDFNADVLKYELIGISEMDCCGVNTENQRQIALDFARQYFSDGIVKRIEEVLQVQYLGCEHPAYVNKWEGGKTIVFNHRAEKYKGYEWFLKAMDKLWEQRQDFNVWVPLAEKPDRDFIYVGDNKPKHPRYFNNLSACCVGVGGFQKYAGWAVAVTDGFSVGVPYLLLDAPYYRELATDEHCFFKSDDELLYKLNRVLDGDRQDLSQAATKRFAELEWPKRIGIFNDMLNKALSTVPCLKSETECLAIIKSIIIKRQSADFKELKKELGWGDQRAFTQYRTALRKDQRFTITQDSYRVA